MIAILVTMFGGGSRRPREKEVDMNKEAVVVISLVIIGFAILVPSYLYADPFGNWY